MSLLLSGKNVFVAGATGEVGKGAALAMAKQGANVWIAGRNIDKLMAIKNDALESNPDLMITPIAADYSTVDGATQLDKALTEEHGNVKFDTAVVSAGPWWPVNDMSKVDDFSVFGKALNANVESHMLLYRVLAPRTKSHYVVVNGAAARGIAQVGLTGVMAYALEGFAKLAYAECSRDGETKPQFTHAMIQSSVGHAAMRGKTHNPVEFGRVFVAMALGKHSTDNDSGLIVVDDAAYENLSDALN